MVTREQADAMRIEAFLRTGQGTIGRKCRTHGRGTKAAVKAGTAARCKDDGRDSDRALSRTFDAETVARLDALFASAGEGGTGFRCAISDPERPVHFAPEPMTREDEIAEMFAQADRF